MTKRRSKYLDTFFSKENCFRLKVKHLGSFIFCELCELVRIDLHLGDQFRNLTTVLKVYEEIYIRVHSERCEFEAEVFLFEKRRQVL